MFGGCNVHVGLNVVICSGVFRAVVRCSEECLVSVKMWAAGSYFFFGSLSVS